MSVMTEVVLMIPASIAPLFDSNIVPCAKDARHICDLLDYHKATLFAMDVELAHARNFLRQLEARRGEIQDLVEKLEVLLSPARRMPTEIIANIFQHCLPAAGHMHPHALEGPLLLGQICSGWRELSLAMPSLWARIDITLPVKSSDWNSTIQKKIALMQTWLARARPLPLSLSLVQESPTSIPGTYITPLMHEVLMTADRLGELTLQLPLSTISSLSPVTHCSLPQLRRLTLHDGSTKASVDHSPAITVHSAPRLRSLSVSWAHLNLREFYMPWHQLTELSLLYEANFSCEPVHSDYLHVLVHCSNLRTLSMGIAQLTSTSEDSNRNPAEPVALPQLCTLKIRCHTLTPYLEKLCNSLRLPALQSFAIHNAHDKPGPFRGETEFLPLLSQCTSTLLHLTVDNVDIPDSEIAAYLKQALNLKTLHFTGGRMRTMYDLVPSLTIPRSCNANEEPVSILCPNLESIFIRSPSVVPAVSIVNMVDSRCREDASTRGYTVLKRFTLDYYPNLDALSLLQQEASVAIIASRLDHRVKQGLQLVLVPSK